MEDQYAILLATLSSSLGIIFGYIISKKSTTEILEKVIKIKILSEEIDESTNPRIKNGEPVKSVGTELTLPWKNHGLTKQFPL